MKNRPAINAQILVGGIFTFNGAVFAAIGILYFIFGDRYSVQGSFEDPVKNFYMLTGIFSVFGLLFFCVGMLLLLSEVRKRHMLKALVDNGYRIYGTISEVYPDTSITINRRNPFYAVCRYEDPVTMKTEIFQSRSFNTDISGAVGMTVSIYIDPADHSKYYMDFDPASIAVKY